MNLTFPQRVLTNGALGLRSTSHTLFSGLALGLTGKYYDGNKTYMKSDYGFSDVLHGLMYASAGLVLNQTAAYGLDNVREKISPAHKNFWEKHLMKIFYTLGGIGTARHLHNQYKKSFLQEQSEAEKQRLSRNFTKTLERI